MRNVHGHRHQLGLPVELIECVQDNRSCACTHVALGDQRILQGYKARRERTCRECFLQPLLCNSFLPKQADHSLRGILPALPGPDSCPQGAQLSPPWPQESDTRESGRSRTAPCMQAASKLGSTAEQKDPGGSTRVLLLRQTGLTWSATSIQHPGRASAAACPSTAAASAALCALL